MSELKSERLLTGKLVLLMVGTFGVFLGNGIITPVLPVFVKDDLGGSDVAVGVVFAVQAIAAIAIRPWLTPKFNAWGVKPILIGSMIASGLSFGLSAFVPNVFWLIVLRLIFGAAMAALFIGGLTAVTGLASPVRSGEAISLFSVAPYLSMGIGPIVGQAIFQAFGYVPTFLLAGGVAMLGVVPMIFYKSVPIAPLADAEGVRLKRFYGPAVWPGIVIALGIVGMLSFGAFMPLFALEIPGLEIQICFLILSVGVLLVRTVGGRLPDRIGPKKTSVLATSALIIGMAGLATTMGPYWAYLAIVPFAFGQALQYPSLLSLTLDDVSEQDRPVAISTFTLFFDVSQGFGGLIVGVVAAVGGYRSVFAASAFAAFIGLMIMLAIVLPRYEAGKKARAAVIA